MCTEESHFDSMGHIWALGNAENSYASPLPPQILLSMVMPSFQENISERSLFIQFFETNFQITMQHM